MAYWLMKSEPTELSIDDLARLRQVPWFGVRNHLARNYMRDHMTVGDGVLFYHSSCPVPGVAGVAEVASKPYPDATQFDALNKYFDPRAAVDAPRWVNVDVKFARKTQLLPLAAMRNHEQLSSMVVLQKGNRLSITPVTLPQWRAVQRLLAA